MQGHIMGQEVRVLTDHGATDNFIHTPLLDELGFHCEVIPPYNITFGNKYSIQCDRTCRGVPVNIQGYKAIADFHPLDKISMQVICGIT